MIPKRSIGLLSLVCIALTLLPAFTACQTGKVTLAPGGVYTEPTLAVIDRAILDAGKALRGFVDWANANSVELAKYPAVVALAEKINTQEKGWTKLAWTARKDYAQALQDYRKAVAAAVASGAPPPADSTLDAHAAMDAALNLLTNVAAQITEIKAANKLSP